MTGVRLVIAGEDTQKRCLPPYISLKKQQQFAEQSKLARDVADIIAKAVKEGTQSLSYGETFYLNHNAPNWREMLPD